MAKSLVIVESPAKAKTINKFLGKDFMVLASVGHIKDLPKSKLGIEIDSGFEPHYELIKGKANTIRELKKAGKIAEKIFLAPDPDREGEAIAWHIAEEIDKKKEKTFRVLFNEITEKAVKEAISSPTTLDQHKYEAQQARRVLDRLVGYQVSPILWDKVRRGLSAGRVQSVAVRIICEREREIQAFVPREYWSITARLETLAGDAFTAKLAKKGGKKIDLNNELDSRTVLSGLEGAPFKLAEVESKETKRNPAAPFTTSKLQQEAARKLGYTAKKTMMLAQQLYEGVEIGNEGPVGLISYMRTDSTRISNEAIAAARVHIEQKFGADYLPKGPNIYKTKKKTQDAHEAIRPTYFQYPPEAVKKDLSRDQFRLYQLIWNRFIACQMTPAIMDQTRALIEAKDYTFSASGSTVKFQGFMAVYIEGQDVEEEKEERLPAFKAGEALKLLGLDPAQHFTQPPPRYTEASLVKELEEKGIGRPSTYAAILSTIQDREYVVKENKQLKPTELGFMVTDLLVQSFPGILDVEFTAHMEEELDMIEDGQMEWREAMKEFYGPFKESLEKAKKEMKNVKAEEVPTDITCEKCGSAMVIKWGRKGKFLACSAYPGCKNTKDFTTGEDGKVVPLERTTETTDTPCPTCGKNMIVKSGRFGRFLACPDYPNCKTTKPLSTGIPCPNQDGGMIVERRTKRGRTFFSCSKYPSCTYATWEMPKAEGD
ncbi:MAG TPA: type I DNA topoisomerase [Deltaproteobacteria bacterium]|nr:MAG: DNA topoisomerase I [Deltaproteobacteria bacterium GWA2_55_82]OGQ65015.1 MAG: DNA topoisomerase I [Deltaproteobacteria bacterium RIFCSPLOWO2_02_FULL_55_12]OIJ73797.1 MAG: DNA topoisomerase I [Deltaproteobacteria bacterium GWC2_55_46]HBG45800.1 type I DNA topoisomerase [Deltaproteobacteria bacterium]HCY09781.1 type I DNA topoisomerase [Deltaproteobacteria bacterium]